MGKFRGIKQVLIKATTKRRDAQLFDYVAGDQKGAINIALNFPNSATSSRRFRPLKNLRQLNLTNTDMNDDNSSATCGGESRWICNHVKWGEKRNFRRVMGAQPEITATTLLLQRIESCCTLCGRQLYLFEYSTYYTHCV